MSHGEQSPSAHEPQTTETNPVTRRVLEVINLVLQYQAPLSDPSKWQAVLPPGIESGNAVPFVYIPDIGLHTIGDQECNYRNSFLVSSQDSVHVVRTGSIETDFEPAGEHGKPLSLSLHEGAGYRATTISYQGDVPLSLLAHMASGLVKRPGSQRVQLCVDRREGNDTAQSPRLVVDPGGVHALMGALGIHS